MRISLKIKNNLILKRNVIKVKAKKKKNILRGRYNIF